MSDPRTRPRTVNSRTGRDAMADSVWQIRDRSGSERGRTNGGTRPEAAFVATPGSGGREPYLPTARIVNDPGTIVPRPPPRRPGAAGSVEAGGGGAGGAHLAVIRGRGV